MRRWTAFALAGVLCLALAALAGGTAPFGRLALALGLPRLAAPLLQDPDWRGIAEYRAGRYDAAAERFRVSGNRYNLGNARARQGEYAAALEGWDGARVRGDDLAAANFDLLAAYYAGLALDPEAPVAWFTERDGGEEEPVASFAARGNARAAGTGEGTTNVGALIGLPELESTGQDRVRRVFDDRFMVANRRWLTSLEDVPGEYLGARIAHERKRRRDRGLAPPEPEDPQ
jgi:Ca-activated chloride channel homolog